MKEIDLGIFDYSKIDFVEVNRLLDLMEDCVERVRAIRKAWDIGYGEG